MSARVPAILTLVLSLPLLAQQPPVAAPPTAAPPAQTPPPVHHEIPKSDIKVSVNEVIVPITVTDEKGRFVIDLDQKDFQILDEGKPQRIDFFTRERNQPVVVGFLIDLSNASRLHWKNYQDSAIELVYNLLPGDPKFSGYLMGYSNEAEVLVDTTSDSEKINEKLRKLKPGGGSALFDAIYMSCVNRKQLNGEPIEPRRVLVIIGDGHDNASKKTLEEALEIAQRNLVTIYCVSTQAFGFNNPDEKVLQRLAEETGGRVEYPLNNPYADVSGYLSTPSDEGNYALKVGTGGYASAIAQGMFHSIANVAGEVTTQYIIRYKPADTDSKKQFRNIEVKVNLANVKVRARKGYYPYNP
ncbi:MAG TPA: VWA domain-containing protein [Bryobacteraceae bacterium]|nr:VWA domain-containing protein [Bryobacteraceae bacterium]